MFCVFDTPLLCGEVHEGSSDANVFSNLPEKQQTTSTSKQASENTSSVFESQRAAYVAEMQVLLLMVPHLHVFDLRTPTSLNTKVKQFWELTHWHC